MKYGFSALVGALCLAAASLAHAQAIQYEGTFSIPPGAAVQGTVGGFGWSRESAVDVDFWSFVGYGGSQVVIQGTRVDAGLDPALDFYYGVTAADISEFRTGRSWSNLQFLGSADDEVASANGPFGDPSITFTLPYTGFYTIAIGGSGSDGEGPFSYNLLVQMAPVPEPGPAALMLAGLGALVWLKSRRMQA